MGFLESGVVEAVTGSDLRGEAQTYCIDSDQEEVEDKERIDEEATGGQDEEDLEDVFPNEEDLEDVFKDEEDSQSEELQYVPRPTRALSQGGNPKRTKA
jgi:hypothetical protein